MIKKPQIMLKGELRGKKTAKAEDLARNVSDDKET